MSPLVGYLLLFLVVGFGFIFVHLLAGKLIRPAKPSAEKGTIYECGEPTVGSAWVQFDLRYYVVALLFVIFDVEVAFFFPWALVFGQANALRTYDPAHESTGEAERVQLARTELLREQNPRKVDESGNQYNAENEVGRDLSRLALLDILVFFGVLLVGFAYLWKRGDLAWVRSTVAAPSSEPAAPVVQPISAKPQLSSVAH